jgi:hypothetical protein
MPTTEHVADDEKLRELVLLISQESEGDAPYGATKLNKLLFYADFIAYVQFGKPITGQEYMRLENGPAPRRLIPITKSMEANKELVYSVRPFLGKTQKRPMALRAPELARFSASEISLVHTLIKQCWGKTAREMSDLSHRFAGWKLAADKEAIPYNVALVARGHRNSAAETIIASLAAEAQECLDRAQDAR